MALLPHDWPQYHKNLVRRLSVSRMIRGCLIWLVVGICAGRTDDSGAPKKAVVVVGRPTAGALTAGDAFPNLAGRPSELRPEPLPIRVRYVFTDDSAVISAASRLSDSLLGGKLDQGKLFSSSLLVYSGAWAVLKTRVNKPQRPSITNRMMMGRRVLLLEMAFLQDAKEVNNLEHALAKIVQEDGGGRIRALKTMEMEKWWAFIPFDIAEPVLVLETKNRAHIFLLNFGKAGLVTGIDELNSLPDSSGLGQ